MAFILLRKFFWLWVSSRLNSQSTNNRGASNNLPQHAVVKFDASLNIQRVIKVEVNQLDPFDYEQTEYGERDKRFYVFDDQSVLVVHSPYFNRSRFRLARYNPNGLLVYNTT